jgi:hypothetical protein
MTACKKSPATDLDASNTVDGSPADAPAPLPAKTTRSIASCSALATGTETCGFEIQLDPSKCANRGCKKLAVFFAGGQQTCTASIAQAYVADGYVAVCALLFQTSTATGLYPYAAEATRADEIMKAIASDPVVRAAWSGQALLITGVSHGATAPVIAMARTTYDNSTAWQGATKTGACFFDGIYNITALDNHLGTGNAGAPCTTPLSHSRIVGRYYATDPATHSCGNGQCGCAPGHSAALDVDSVDGIAATEFAVKDCQTDRMRIKSRRLLGRYRTVSSNLNIMLGVRCIAGSSVHV